MNVSTYFDHWSIMENPFRAEEARHDPVFSRLEAGPTAHPDFEKIVGDLFRPSTAIVFGEKGSGKTAIRMQLASRIARHNDANPEHKLLLVPYDDLNPMLDRFCAGVKAGDEGRDILKALKKLRLVDHMDGILSCAVPIVVDLVLGEGSPDGSRPIEDGSREAPWRLLRRASVGAKRDLQVLAALYDRPTDAERRGSAVRWRIGPPYNRHRLLWRGLALFGWLIPVGVAAASFYTSNDWIGPLFKLYAFYAALALWVAFLLKWFVVDRWLRHRLARRLLRRMKTVRRSPETIARGLEFVPPDDRPVSSLPIDDADDRRYAMFDRLRRVTHALGYTGLAIVMDRVDEPTLVSGDPDRMRAVVWPLMNNKFLQQDGIGLKLLLPIELRHELFRESSAFFQEARLDKQNLIERLTWTGPILFDLCNARLAACRSPGAGAITLTDLFAEDVKRQDVVDALDQMRQPRDAFKMLYQCVQEHCSNVTEEQGEWRIPRLVLETVRKQQADRVQMLYRGVRPA